MRSAIRKSPVRKRGFVFLLVVEEEEEEEEEGSS
jgi:hypothetical protein